ncbi:hypothetical protein Bca4012_060886 [Brassica carinata]
MSETRSDWSKLCPDLLRSIFGRLIISKDFYRSRTVCSDWYSVSTTCVPTAYAYPWRILFDEDSTLLFDPGEDNIYEIGHPQLDLIKTHVMASCSNWLLIGRSALNLYLQNVFTRERINLPVCRRLTIENSSSCLWINERTRDYVVACSSKQGCLFSCKNGDVKWLCHIGIECAYVTYKDGKLYVYTFDRCIEILDFLSGDLLVQGNPYHNHPFHIDDSHPKSVVITSSGELFIVVTFKGVNNRCVDEILNRSFNVYKMNLDNGSWERVYSLGGEMLIFGHGVGIKAPIKDVNGWGIKSDTICFGGDEDDIFPSDRYSRTTNCGVFDLATGTQTSLDVPFFKSFWFVPVYEISDHETGFFF